MFIVCPYEVRQVYSILFDEFRMLSPESPESTESKICITSTSSISYAGPIPITLFRYLLPKYGVKRCQFWLLFLAVAYDPDRFYGAPLYKV